MKQTNRFAFVTLTSSRCAREYEMVNAENKTTEKKIINIHFSF